MVGYGEDVVESIMLAGVVSSYRGNQEIQSTSYQHMAFVFPVELIPAFIVLVRS